MRRLILYGVIVFQIALIVSLIRGIQLSAKSSSRIENMQETKAKLEKERDKLKKDEEYVASDYYLEKVARDELHLSKIGETVVILPDRVGEVIEDSGPLKNGEQKQNWEKWWSILSGIK